MRWTKAGLVLAAALVAAAGIAVAAAPQKITPAGVGAVKLGKSYEQLHAKGLIGGIRKGCELAPNTRSAPLRQPLRGNVDFTLKDPRNVRNITVRKGGAARGVGIGATTAEIQAAFPAAKVDHSTEEVFGITLVKIPKSGGGKLQFAVDVGTGKVTLIGIPFIAFCE